MSSESVCQVARSWVDVGSFHARLFGVVYFAIEKNEMGGACGTYGGGERCAQGVGVEARGKEAIGKTQT
jgi:hypothetical protein